MPFRGREQMGKDNPSGGRWVKMQDDVPVTVTVVGYVGTSESKKYPGKVQYRFDVLDENGQQKHLDCNWKLMRLLEEQVELHNQSFACTILQKKVIAEITSPDGTKKKQLVNEYVLSGVKPTDGDADLAF